MGSIDTQVDVGGLSLVGLNSFSTVLGALSADDVQPTAMLQLENLGVAFPISGPLRAQIPDYLQRCKSTRLERLGIMVGWRKGDSASLMSHSAGGQAVALLATCLENIYGNDATATILYKLSKSLLSNAARFSSPKQLLQAADILARKMGAIGFGTILAKHVSRIHDVYWQLHQKAPASLLASLSQDGMSDLLSKFSSAICEEKCLVRIRGCASMGYVFPLAVTLFADDCIVTVENMVIHQGCHSSSISIEITKTLGDGSFEVQMMGKIKSILDIPVRQSRLSASMKFSYRGHFSEYTRLCLQEIGLTCVPEVLLAMGTCILSLSDLINVPISGRSDIGSRVTVNLFSQIFSESPRVHVHRRCEEAFGMSLPLKWPSFSETLAQLKLILARSNHAESFARLADQIHLYIDPSDILLRIIDEGVASLVVRPYQGVVWQKHTNPRTWHPSESLMSQRSTEIILNPSDLLRQLFSWDDPTILATSEGSTTLIPASILYFGNDICQYRGLEIMDGLIFHDNRYQSKIYSEPGSDILKPVASDSTEAKEIYATADGVQSSLSLSISEHVKGLVLDCSATFAGQKKSISFRECVDQSFGLLDAHSCRHSRKTPLRKEYVKLVKATSVLTPDGRSGDQLSLVQTVGSPSAQFMSLTKWESAILCRSCCLNCAYEQAREKEICKIIVA